LPKGFDYIFYSNHHTDLFNAFGHNKNLLENHYITCGRFEHRNYCNIPDNFNWQKYILFNRNVFDTMDKCTKDNAIYHFLNNNDNNDNNDNNTVNYIDNDNDVNDANASANDKPMCIVYYAYLYNGQKWKNIVTGQIRHIYDSGILKKSDLHVVLLGTPHEIQEAKLLLENITNDTINVTEVYNNLYEFPALIKIRELAVLNPNKIFIYFHSKGMVNWNPSLHRTLVEQKLTNSTFLNWDTTLFIFNNFPEIQKAGGYPAKEGWFWFNFWWARGSYLISCSPIEIPINMVENDRFICEFWLGKNGSNTWTDSYSFVTKNISYSNDPSKEILSHDI
jgi:hypothetical protein